MEEKKIPIVSLHKAGKSDLEIFRTLENLDVNRKLVYRTLLRYRETRAIVRRPGSGRKRTSTDARHVRLVRQRLQRNPRRSARKIARDMGISPRSVT